MKPITAIGLDIGSYAIKCVEISQINRSIKLHRASILPLSDHSPKNILSILDLIIDRGSAAAKKVRISVSGPSILIRRITLPLMTPHELKGAIRFEAESHIPFPIADCVLDFQILAQQPAKKTMTVLLVAVKRDFIDQRLKLLAQADIHPEVIDVDIFCLINAYEVLSDSQPEHAYGLLNIGHQVSSFAIIQDKVPFFVREIPFGGFQISEALAEIKGVQAAEADKLKIDCPADLGEALKSASRKGLEALAEELRHSVDYFENESEQDLRSIWLSGGGALAKDASEVLSEELGKKVSLWDNTKKMEVFGDVDQKFLADHSSELNVALGMVLRGMA